MSWFRGLFRRERRSTADQVSRLADQLAVVAEKLEVNSKVATARFAGLEHATADSREAIADVRRSLNDVDGHITQMLTEIYADESGDRRRLARVRSEPDYDLAFSEAEPLVSVLVPTYMNWRDLRDRSLPSILSQTYERLEVIVVGDGAPAATGEVIEGLGDERVRFVNLGLRGPYPEDDIARWLVSAVPPFNAGLREARGRWIAPFADDDSLKPDAIEVALHTARAGMFELCYGKLEFHRRNGVTDIVGEFPPRLGASGLQGAVYHSSLRVFEQLLGGYAFRVPNDWLMLRRMLHAGVRFGFVDRVLAEYYPSYRAHPDADRSS